MFDKLEKGGKNKTNQNTLPQVKTLHLILQRVS